MYAYLLSKLSKESFNEVQGNSKWISVETSREPLELWKLIKESHQTTTTSKVTSVIKKSTREE
jgi:hypothetical protein